MSIYNITENTSNRDMLPGETLLEAKERYLKIHGNFESKLPMPDFYPSPERSDIFILDFAKGPCGLKAYGAEKLIAELEGDVMGYAAPRVGHAAEAIASLAETYGKKCVFFAAASKQVTPHQAVVLAYDKCELRFVKIPAMPCLNSWIRDWAKEFNAVALPFGLANTPEVTAGLVKVCDDHTLFHGEPPEFFCAVSTGTMIRALQIGWPNAKARGVAVARNIKDGEKGKSDVVSYHKTFYKGSEYMPEFNTTATYDAKAYKRFIDEAQPGAIFINVGSDTQIEDRLQRVENWDKIDAVREWGDQSAFSYGMASQ